jgi:hypothetical protein
MLIKQAVPYVAKYNAKQTIAEMRITIPAYSALMALLFFVMFSMMLFVYDFLTLKYKGIYYKHLVIHILHTLIL